MNTVEIRKILGISRAEFSRRYGIPIRTLEDWDHEKRRPPEWMLKLLQRVVEEDASKEDSFKKVDTRVDYFSEEPHKIRVF